MPELLGQEWLDRQRAETALLPVRPGATARIQYEISDGPAGPVVFHTHLEDGRITANALGPDDDPDFTVLVPHGQFVEIVRGTLDPSVGYMQGRVKVAGNIGRMLSVLPVTTSPEWRAAMARLAADTTGC
jgi:putative sterol carrier protein